MALSLTTQTTLIGGLTEIMNQMVNAGWFREPTANPLNVSGVDYYILSSLANQIGQTYHVMLYSPTAGIISAELFETYNSSTNKKQFWAPSGSDTPNTNGQVNQAEQALNYSTNVGVCLLNYGTTGAFTLLVKATADYIVVAVQNNLSQRTSFYIGSYSPYSWNTETMPLVMTNFCTRDSCVTTMGHNNWVPGVTSYGSASTTTGSSLTRERFPGSFTNNTSNPSVCNFLGSYLPLKAMLLSSATSGSPGYAAPVAGSRDAFAHQFVAMDVLMYKGSGYSNGSQSEFMMGKYRDIQDIGGIGASTIGTTAQVNGTTYYSFGAAAGVQGDVYVPEG